MIDQPISPNPVIIWGAIEGIGEESQAIGWARASDPAASLQVTLRRGQKLLGSGVPTIFRPDIGGDNGFRIKLNEAVTAWDITSGAVVCTVAAGDGKETVLQLTKQLQAKGAIEFLITLDPAILKNSGTLANLTRLATTAGAQEQADIRARIDVFSPRDSPDLPAYLEKISLPTGLIAQDGSAIFGFDNHAFLIEGSNSLLAQYAADPESPTVRDTAAQWLQLIRDRAVRCAARGAQFQQILIPEKCSILHERFPRTIPPRTPMLARIEAEVRADNDVARKVLLAGDHLGAESCQRFDTHLNARGAINVIRALLVQMDLEWPFDEPLLDAAETRSGDLSGRFIPGAMLSEVIEIPGEGFVATLPEPMLIDQRNTERHLSTKRIWETPDAPFDLRVLAFGGSSFERGGSATMLSWWCARLFRHFTFHWSPDMLDEEIANQRPDHVICQTIERFLPRVPMR